MNRKEILEAAIAHTCGDRDVEYGSPSENFASIRSLWDAYLYTKYGQELLTAEDVAWMMVLLKMARSFRGETKSDTYEDAAAYTAIAGEVS